MPKNLGSIDRIIRVVLALTVLVLFLTHQISGTVALIAGALAVILVLTSLVSFCPLYLPFNLSTRGK